MSEQLELDDWQPDRNLGMELVRATEAAAIKASNFVGRGDKLLFLVWICDGADCSIILPNP